jgi:D-apionolactonase
MSDKIALYEAVSLGQLALRLDPIGAFAREISLGGEELFRGIGFVVRDAHWGTPTLTGETILSRQNGRTSAKSGGDLNITSGDLTWSTEWSITESGLEVKGTASSVVGFETNRTGFVILHSLGATRGRAVKVFHPGGGIEETTFPDLVSPHQPFFDIEALEYTTTAGTRLRLSFSGEVFEIEDQRNWTDASYKTYCRPLRLPYPYRIEPSTVIEQSVRLKILAPTSAPTPRRTAPWIERTAVLPLLGTSLPPRAFDIRQVADLGKLKLGFVAIEMDLSDEKALMATSDKIAAAPGPLRIDIRKSEEKETLAAVTALAPLVANKSVVGLSLWDAEDSTIAAARAAAPTIRIGGGTGAFFTELNRMPRWPAVDYLTWTSNPTVHGSSDDTIGETTEPLADIIRTARARSDSARFQIGPMTLGLRYNPNSTTPEGRHMAAPPDPRQSERIAAAWAIGTIAGFLDPAVETLAFFEPIGPKGLLSDDGSLTPAAHVLSRLSSYSGCKASVMRWPNVPRAVGLLIETPGGSMLCFAHPRDEEFSISPPPGFWSRAEQLSANGFRDIPAAEFRAERFGVAWLTAEGVALPSNSPGTS